MISSDKVFMRAAIWEAQKGCGKTAPNPAVGAVIVENGVIGGRGFHAEAGLPHAEIKALEDLGHRPLPKSQIFVTLEPCSTIGRTKACTDAIIEAGIERVVIGAIYPDPRHRGQGIEILKAHGIEVIQGILADECEALNPEFNQRMKEQ